MSSCVVSPEELASPLWLAAPMVRASLLPVRLTFLQHGAGTVSSLIISCQIYTQKSLLRGFWNRRGKELTLQVGAVYAKLCGRVSKQLKRCPDFLYLFRRRRKDHPPTREGYDASVSLQPHLMPRRRLALQRLFCLTWQATTWVAQRSSRKKRMNKQLSRQSQAQNGSLAIGGSQGSGYSQSFTPACPKQTAHVQSASAEYCSTGVFSSIPSSQLSWFGQSTVPDIPQLSRQLTSSMFARLVVLTRPSTPDMSLTA
eukprot:284815758_4